jgi:hypothetical protein
MDFDTYIKTVYCIFFKISYAIIYNAMYAFSLCQIKYNGFVKYASAPDSSVDNNAVPQIEFITRGVKVDIADVKNMLTFLQSDSGELRMGEHSFLILISTINGVHNKLMLQTGDKLCTDPELTEYSFISIELVFDDDVNQTAHKILLKVGDDNYYVVGNVIDAEFITYYMHKYLKLKLENYSQKYTLNVVDGNVNCFSMTQDDRMLLKKNEYTLSR